MKLSNPQIGDIVYQFSWVWDHSDAGIPAKIWKPLRAGIYLGPGTYIGFCKIAFGDKIEQVNRINISLNKNDSPAV